MLGPSLLVAPSFVPDTEESEYYLPAGRWTSFYNPQRMIEGPVWVKEKVALDDIALWVRQGSILLLGPEKTSKPDYAYDKGLEIRLYEFADGQSAEVGAPSGKAGSSDISGFVKAERAGKDISISVTSGKVGLSAVSLYASGQEVDGVEGGILKVSGDPKEIKLKLK